MSIIYIGFSNDDQKTQTVAAPSAVAQSDFTFKLISEITKTEYFYCLDYLKEKNKKDTKQPLQMRLGLILNLVDSFRALAKIKKRTDVKKIILYHSLSFFFLIPLLRIIGKHVIIQLNEIYSNEVPYNTIKRKIMEKIIISFSNEYILSTKELIKDIPNKNIDPNKIPIIPGPLNLEHFQVHKKKKTLSLVYVGVIDKAKVEGAFMSVNLAKFLNDKNFIIYIYGYGTNKNITDLNKNIEISNKKYLTKVFFKGCLPQSKLIKSIQKYDIGLALQPARSFSETSFPSKILTYISAGLFPVCSYSKPIESWVSENNIGYVHKNDNLSDLAEKIKKLNHIDQKAVNIKAQKIYKTMKNKLLEYLL